MPVKLFHFITPQRMKFSIKDFFIGCTNSVGCTNIGSIFSISAIFRIVLLELLVSSTLKLSLVLEFNENVNIFL